MRQRVRERIDAGTSFKGASTLVCKCDIAGPSRDLMAVPAEPNSDLNINPNAFDIVGSQLATETMIPEPHLGAATTPLILSSDTLGIRLSPRAGLLLDPFKSEGMRSS